MIMTFFIDILLRMVSYNLDVFTYLTNIRIPREADQLEGLEEWIKAEREGHGIT